MMMPETMMNTSALPEILFRLIPTEKVRVKEIDGIIQLMPVKENTDCTIGLRGILAGYMMICLLINFWSVLREKTLSKAN